MIIASTSTASAPGTAMPLVVSGPGDVLEADRTPDGMLRQNNVFRYVVAVAP